VLRTSAPHTAPGDRPSLKNYSQYLVDESAISSFASARPT